MSQSASLCLSDSLRHFIMGEIGFFSISIRSNLSRFSCLLSNAWHVFPSASGILGSAWYFRSKRMVFWMFFGGNSPTMLHTKHNGVCRWLFISFTLNPFWSIYSQMSSAWVIHAEWSRELPLESLKHRADSIASLLSECSKIAFNSVFELFRKPFSKRTWNGHTPLSFFFHGSIPKRKHSCHRSTSTSSVIKVSLLINLCKKVSPLRSCAFGCAPCFSNKSTCTQNCARCSGVSPMSFLAFTAPPQSIILFSTSSWFLSSSANLAHRCSGVFPSASLQLIAHPCLWKSSMPSDTVVRDSSRDRFTRIWRGYLSESSLVLALAPDSKRQRQISSKWSSSLMAWNVDKLFASGVSPQLFLKLGLAPSKSNDLTKNPFSGEGRISHSLTAWKRVVHPESSVWSMQAPSSIRKEASGMLGIANIRYGEPSTLPLDELPVSFIKSFTASWITSSFQHENSGGRSNLTLACIVRNIPSRSSSFSFESVSSFP